MRWFDELGIRASDFVFAACASVLAITISGEKSFRVAIAMFLSGIICGLALPPWVKQFIYTYGDPLHVGVVSGLALMGFTIVKAFQKAARKFLRDDTLTRAMKNRNGKDDDSSK